MRAQASQHRVALMLKCLNLKPHSIAELAFECKSVEQTIRGWIKVLNAAGLIYVAEIIPPPGGGTSTRRYLWKKRVI